MLKRGVLLSALLSLTLVACPQPVEPIPSGKPVITSFTTTPASLPSSGGSSKLEWQVTGADSVSLDNGIGVVTGSSRDVNVTVTTTYTLTATNAQGSVTQSTTVTVAGLPPTPTKLSGTISPWTRGTRVLKSAVSTQTGSVNILSGTMDANGAFEVPLSVPLSAALTSATLGLGADCLANLAISPSSFSIAPITSLSVLTSTGALSGALSLGNISGPVLTPQAGNKFVVYIYSDQNATIKGTCTNAPGTSGSLTIDWNLKQGWNTTLVEYTSATAVRYVSVNAIPADVTWQFTPASGGVVKLSNVVTSLEVGQSVTLSASATEPDGTPMLNPEFVWSSGDSSLLEVTQGGVVTAKAIGYANGATISVSLKNAGATGASAYITTFGLEAVGGTFNLENASLGTAVRLRYQPPSGSSTPSSFGYTITGPSGWNNNQPLAGTYTPGYDSFGVLSEIPAVNGSYVARTDIVAPMGGAMQASRQMRLVLPRVPVQYPITQPAPANRVQTMAANSVGSTFTIDTAKKLDVAPNFRVTGYLSNQPTVAWDYLPNITPSDFNSRYQLEVKDQTSGQVVLTGQQASYSPASIYGVTFDINHVYAIRLQTIQGFRTGEVSASRATATLDFRPEVTQLSTSGGAKTGGYNLTITGYNFDINTAVFFGNIEATSKSLQGSTSMQVVVPAGTSGTVDVKLSNARGNSTLSALTKFTYYDIQEFSVASASKLLAGSGGAVYFIEEDSNRSPSVSLAKITSAGSITRVGLSGVSYYSLRDMTLDTTDNVWVAFENKLLRVSSTNQVTDIPLPSGVMPQMIAFGSDGNLWIARSDSNNLTRMQTDGSNAATFALAGSSSFGNSFYNGNEMLLGPDGNVWFTNSSGYGRVTLSGSITILNTSFYSAGGLIMFDGALWVSSQYGNTLTRVNTDGTTVNYTNTCGSFRFARGGDGAFWCAGNGFASSGDGLRRTVLTATVGSNEGIALPVIVNGSSVSELVADSNGKLWYARGAKIGVVTP
jgi:hypothetical protein